MALTNDIIDGKYVILRKIDERDSVSVYLAIDIITKNRLTIKEFCKGDEKKQRALIDLLDEANLIQKLDHPAIPRIVDIIESEFILYIVMDFIEGESLQQVLWTYGAQPVMRVIEWGRQLCDVLHYLHTRTPPIIYRNLTPRNIILRPNGSLELKDFRFAMEYQDIIVGDNSNLGTMGYAAPEQFLNQRHADARTDIFSLGVVLYYLITNNDPTVPPYQIISVRKVNPSLPADLEKLIKKCTQLNPAERYQSCDEVTYVLDKLTKY